MDVINNQRGVVEIKSENDKGVGEEIVGVYRTRLLSVIVDMRGIKIRGMAGNRRLTGNRGSPLSPSNLPDGKTQIELKHRSNNGDSGGSFQLVPGLIRATRRQLSEH